MSSENDEFVKDWLRRYFLSYHKEMEKWQKHEDSLMEINERLFMDQQPKDTKEVSRDKLIARIQCFEDELREWYHKLLEPTHLPPDDQETWVNLGAKNMLSDVLDSYEDLFGDITVCKYDGKGF